LTIDPASVVAIIGPGPRQKNQLIGPVPFPRKWTMA